MTNKIKKSCCYCGRSITTNNLAKHEKACLHLKPALSPEELKKKRQENIEKARNSITPEIRASINKKVSEAHKRGCYGSANSKKRGVPGKPHSEQTKKLISEKARASKHRRLRKNSKLYCGERMDSSWEVKFAQWLDGKSIAWERPGPLPYDDGRCYFPDFYLPEFNLFVDTKNDFLIEHDTLKIRKARLQNEVEIIILSKRDLMQLGVM